MADSVVDARRAYLMFESLGDHWGMGMAAMGVGQWEAGRGGQEADVWLTRAMDHLTLIGAVQDARTVLVVRELRRALLGSADALSVLTHVARSSSSSSQERAHALLGLGMVAARAGRWDDCLRHAEEGVAVAHADAGLSAQARIMAEVTAAVLTTRGGGDGRPLLELAAETSLRTADMPVLGFVALGHAELAAARGDVGRAQELWALGTRLGADLSMLFGASVPGEPTDVLGTPDERATMLREVHQRPIVDARNRVAALLG